MYRAQKTPCRDWRLNDDLKKKNTKVTNGTTMGLTTDIDGEDQSSKTEVETVI